MTTTTEHLGLKRHTTADVFRIQDYADNWNKLDASPGTFLCDSTTRPSNWTVAQTGMLISERDTGLIYRWNGTQYVRVAAKGFLGQAGRYADIQATGTSYITAIQVSINLPPSSSVAEGPGIRWVQVNVVCPQVVSTVALTQMAIYRGATQLTEWFAKGGNGTLGSTPSEYPSNESIVIEDRPTGTGTYIYSLRFRPVAGLGGISTVRAADGRPATITVIEV